MSESFYEIAFTPGVKDQQSEHGSRRQYERMEQALAGHNQLGPDEQNFIALRDSFYMASVSETGWPYIQHRGGRPGLRPRPRRPTSSASPTFAATSSTSRLGNLSARRPRRALPHGLPATRRVSRSSATPRSTKHDDRPELCAAPHEPNPDAVIERAMLIHVSGFDWNCPQHITPRYTIAELEPTLAPLRKRLATLEAENAKLRERLEVLTT